MDDGDRENLLSRVTELNTEKEVVVLNKSGDGFSHGGYFPPFRGGGFSLCRGLKKEENVK
ncbi:MAG: hypothetical protein KKH04_07635 [Proteobacteria bacterium]|nr:hypothetical protein [Pseudomonadota bacterium]